VPLTPADVSSKLFSRGMRGYNMEEVDTFLDEVEEELTRLLRENNELRQRAESAAALAGSGPVASGAAAPAAAPVAAPVAPGEGQEAALRTLLLAQRTADTAIAEARAEAEELVAKARAEAEATTESSRKQAEQAVTSARSEAERARTSAKAEADRLLTAARDKSASVDAEVAAKISSALHGLDDRRKELEGHIEALRAFEREYRTRLKAYLEGQLRELDSRKPGDAVDSPPPPAPPASPFADVAGPQSGATAGTGPAASGPRPSMFKPGVGGAAFPAVEPAQPTPSSPFARPGAAPAGDGPLGLRAVPPLAEQSPEPVGPFSSEPPTGPPAGAEGTGPDAEGNGPDAEGDEASADSRDDGGAPRH
jgi:DivIVA domain-containing protein